MATWLKFNGNTWDTISGLKLYEPAKNSARLLYTASKNIKDENIRKKSKTFARKSESLHFIKNTIEITKSLPGILDEEPWDTNPMLLGVNNGVIDLKTGALRDGLRTDRITKNTNIEYDPKAKCQRYEKFLKEIFSNDMDLIEFIKRAIGYSLTGRTDEEVLFLCVGSGANGKSKLLSVLQNLMGGYSYNAPFSLIESSNRNSIPNDVAALQGRRLVTAGETDNSAKLNESRIKALTGNDTITARFLHDEFFEFRPVCKLWLSTNNKPRVQDCSEGFWRRILIIPFENTFKGRMRDNRLEEKLNCESQGILNWAIEGCLEWQNVGLNPPTSVIAATEDYKLQEDPLNDFINERCVINETGQVKPKELYDAYTTWCRDKYVKYQLGSRKFYENMGLKFRKVTIKGQKYYRGIGLKHKSVTRLRGVAG